MSSSFLPGLIQIPQINLQAIPHESARPAQVTGGSVERASRSLAGKKDRKSKQQVSSQKTDTPDDGKVVKMRVSSKNLSLASPVFEKTFHGLWKEAQGLRVGHMEMEMDWQNIDAMLILMNAIHGHGPEVPREVSLEMLTEISILVDYYNCHKTIQLALDLWMRPLQAGMAKDFCDDIVRWIWISWVSDSATHSDLQHTAQLRRARGQSPALVCLFTIGL